MGYQHIENLYKNQDILLFKECYVMEKIHGTSAHISWNDNKLGFFSGGSNYNMFIDLFNKEDLCIKFKELGYDKVIVYGESYGGKCQGMNKTYGDKDRFVVFEVKIGDNWLDVPNAESVSLSLGLDFVPYEKCSTDIDILTAIRNKSSEQAIKCGITEPKKREGIVLRPIIEVTKNNGTRIIAKYKNDDFIETKKIREANPAKLAVLKEANAIAEEWVTEMRLIHILQKIPDANIKQTGIVIATMIEDVERESEGEIIKSKEARVAIGKKTATMFKAKLNNSLHKED